MKNLLWLDKKNFDDIFLIVHSAFLGWVTDSMQASYIANRTENELDLVILFNKKPLELDLSIVTNEILFNIEDSICDYGINKINYHSIILDNTVGEFKETGGHWVNEYWPVFQKYDPMPYDLE